MTFRWLEALCCPSFRRRDFWMPPSSFGSGDGAVRFLEVEEVVSELAACGSGLILNRGVVRPRHPSISEESVPLKPASLDSIPLSREIS